MEFLSSVFFKTAGAKAVIGSVLKERLPIEANGLSDIHKSLLISAVLKETKRKIILITPDEASATVMCEDMSSLGLKAALLPARDLAVAGFVGHSKEYEHKRIDTLSKLLDGAFDVVLVSAESASQFTIPSRVLEENTFSLRQGETVKLGELCEKLVLAGYTRVEQVDGTGQFAVRGGILDIFSINSEFPARVEFWGDEIDTISYFEIDSQRRTDNTEILKITPANEVICDREILKEKLQELAEDKKLTEKQRTLVYRDIEALESGLYFSFDRYINLIYPDCTIFDYFDNPLIITSEYKTVKERALNHDSATNEDIKLFLEDGFVNQKTAKFHISEEELTSICSKGILLDSFMPSSLAFGLKETVSFELKRNSGWGGDISVLKDDIGYMLSKGGVAVIAAGSEKAAKLLCEDLSNSGISAIYLEKLKGLPARGVVVTVGGMSSGFEIPELGFSFITHKIIYSDKSKNHRKRSKNSIGSLEELKHGDYVVHASHGIGIFEGINRITNSGITKDYIKIKYAKGDILYVPVTQLDLVSKYIGSAEDSNIKLNRLGGQEWQKTRKRVRAAVKDMAKQLTELYAKRMAIKGHAFSPDTDLQNDFERRFEYEETEDQLRCINEIKNDMERTSPMDRLLCGDVGFGKTEVALRAAFKCISEGKQCAILVPTTILAWQHYNTILKRFGEMPVEVRLLSRFVSSKEQAKTITGLKRGNIDLVVGTHRLISKDILFKDLGLVIIDEEQRFGVAQKERLKEAYPAVDVLTLSATPIPRTLNMAMSGLRDLSSIDEAPNDRHPVQTYVLEQHNGILLEAIRKELRRGGQVYYLHNRVETINRVALKLSEQLPDCRVAVAHGKMSEEELSEVWKKLVEHEIDLLVCTTIIETGVDVPNANTLIIEDADRFGLSQLHQLRGRVGRSPRRAYAYFCFRQGRGLSEIATKRLEAIREYTEFGSGFKIAMRDLEIRGAGSILGGEQHGNMEAVGYDMYLKLLSEAMSEEKGIKVEPEAECTVDLSISAHIPESYIESLPARLGIYRRIADIKTKEDAEDVIDELCDRFGEPPRVVLGLIDIALFRSRAAKCGIYEINQSGDTLILRITEIKEEQVNKLCDGLNGRVTLNVSEKPFYSVKLRKGQNVAAALKEIAELL